MLRRPAVACDRPPSKWYTTLSWAHAADAASASASAASHFAAVFTGDAPVLATPPTLREAVLAGKSAHGETPGDLGARAGRRLPLFHGGRSRAPGRERVG